MIQYIISHSTSYLNLNQPKIILKDLLRPDFNENFINREKQGFVFNLESWVYKNLEVINETFENGIIVEVILKTQSKNYQFTSLE